MARKGYDLLGVYLDDILAIADSREACAEAHSVLIKLLLKLGFAIHWGKIVDPTTKITFLGIELDSLTMSLRLPADNLVALKQELQGVFFIPEPSHKATVVVHRRTPFMGSRCCKERTSVSPSNIQPNKHVRHNSHRALLAREVRRTFSGGCGFWKPLMVGKLY